MSTSKKFVTTISCNKGNALVIGENWLRPVGVHNLNGERLVDFVMPRPGTPFLQSRFMRVNEDVVLSPGVMITVLDASKPSKVRLCIEAGEGVPISHGFPQASAPERTFKPLSQIPGFSGL